MSTTRKAKHDQFCSRSLEYPAIFKSLMNNMIFGELKEQVTWTDLARVDRTKTDPYLNQRKGDIIYKSSFTPGGDIIFGVEHQSTKDPMMPVRYLRYLSDNLEMYLKAGHQKWPLMVSFLLYHGSESPYPYSNITTDYYQNPTWGNKELFFRFHPLDLTQISDQVLLTYGLCAPLLILLKHSRDGKLELEAADYNQVFSKCIQEVGEEYIISMLAYTDSLTNLEVGRKMHIFVEELFKDKSHIIMTYGQFLKQEARLEGMQEGRLEGMQQNNLTVAKGMLQEGLEISLVEKITKLPKQEIEKLRKE